MASVVGVTCHDAEVTAHGIPADPTFPTDSEREVWERLLAQGGDDWTLLANVRLTDAKKDHELDVVVLMPDVGVLVLEVKGGQVRVEGEDWVTGTGDHRRVIHPVSQARDGKYALRHYIETDPRWKQSSRSRVRFGHAVITPYTALADDFATPDCPRWMIHGRDDQADLAGRLWDTAARQEGGHRVPTLEDCELITQILRGRNLPQRTMLAEADERENRADRLTVEQATILAVTRLLNRVEVRGGAGSGKTVLAMTQGKQLTRGIHGMPGQRVALLCYSLGLASWFKRSMQGVDRRHRPAFVGTFEDLASYLGVGEFGTRDNATFWEEDLPRRMAELVADLPDGKKFDAIVVDEAQDFADLWWTPIMRCLRDEEKGGLFVYSDENQRVFARFGRPPVPLVPLVLDHNLRNTKQIAETFVPLAPMRMYARGGDGPDVTFVPCAATEAIDVADDQVDPLALFGPDAASDFVHVSAYANAPDIYLNSSYDPVLDEVSAFEELVGCHGGLGGWQTRPLLVHPAEWSLDADLLDDRGRLRGAETVHRQLVRWLERLGQRTDLPPDAGAADRPSSTAAGPARAEAAVAPPALGSGT